VILPENANALLKARMSGVVPSDALIVVFTGKRYNNYEPIVYANATKDYDWRFAKGLNTYVVWHSELCNFDRHMRALCKSVKQPVEYYHVDKRIGGSLFLLPRFSDVDAVCQNKMDFKRMRWDLDDTPWMKWQNQDMERFLKEIDLATGTGFH
jgi:hypothetical protein